MNRAFTIKLCASLIFAVILFPVWLRAQETPQDSSIVYSGRRQNAWLSVGLGKGRNETVAGQVGGWYANNHLVVGISGAAIGGWWDAPTSMTTLLVGGRRIADHGYLLIAGGPARLTGRNNRTWRESSTSVPGGEIVPALWSEAVMFLPYVGIGADWFWAQSRNRLVSGVTVSVQLGYLGR
jgi:hypothetical protein